MNLESQMMRERVHNLEGCIAAERAPVRLENGGDPVARGVSKYTPS